jgi:hypothetical protein
MWQAKGRRQRVAHRRLPGLSQIRVGIQLRTPSSSFWSARCANDVYLYEECQQNQEVLASDAKGGGILYSCLQFRQNAANCLLRPTLKLGVQVVRLVLKSCLFQPSVFLLAAFSSERCVYERACVLFAFSLFRRSGSFK